MDGSRTMLAMARILFAALVLAHAGTGRTAEPVRIGALQFGTVSWELDTIKHHRLDAANGIDLDVVHFAGEEASNVAMLAGELDLIVSDWLWVSGQRSAGADVTMIPFSTAVGAIMVRQDSAIGSLADLDGKTIGVAGGPLDKAWLLVRGQALHEHDLDLPARNEIVFAAPPLLAEKAMQGELDAVMNFWHYCARLEARGFRRLIDAGDAAIALGASGEVSALGWVFRDSWARDRAAALHGFIEASRQAKQLLATSDEEWLRLAPLMRAEGRELSVLRDRFRAGIPQRPAAEEEKDAALLFRVLAELGGEQLTGSASEMAPGTFWVGGAE